jgi:NTE family protein
MTGQKKPASCKPLKLALQGGGAHGAFTWGVLDALLADGRVRFEAVAGASAGAMNAVALADGLASGGAEAARRQLNRFWQRISLDGGLPAPAQALFDTMLTAWGMAGGALNPWLGMLGGATSPYDLNPLNINPLRDILEAEIDFARLRRAAPFRLAIAATNVETGKPRVFAATELTADHLLASACLPTLFKAVEIEGVPYWDGGYVGNPPLYPLFEGACADILLIQINPVRREGAPQSAADIQHRLNEISFNSPLLHELRAIDFVARLIEAGVLANTHHKRIFMHRIAMSDYLDEDAGSKMSTSWTFLKKLKHAGQKAGQDWLTRHFDDLGHRPTMDLRREFL